MGAVLFFVLIRFVMQFARRICYSLFAQQDNQSLIVDILTCVLDSMAGECKVMQLILT